MLVAVGRRPNSSIPGLDSTRVQVDERGFIMVDEQRRTDEPSIFAIGDVVGEPMLAHKASHEGRVAVEVIAGENVGVRAARDSRGRLHRSRDRVGRADRNAGGEGRPQGHDREVSVGRVGPRDHARSHATG